MSEHRHINLAQIARETMVEEGFDPDIPATVDQEVGKLNEGGVIANAKARDLRQLLWSSIDNASSRDLDQIEFVEKVGDSFRVLIGIADVDSFAPKGSATDSYAFENTTSVYTGVKTFPMLPEELSTDKSSLVQAQDRLAVVIEMMVNTDGTVTTGDVFPALVNNHAKLSYEAIGSWFDANAPLPDEVTRIVNLEQQLRLQFEAAKYLGAARQKHGALRLQTIQATPVIDEHDQIVEFSSDQQNSAKELIENFMVAANGAMAEFLDSKGVISLRRVVQTPENWPRIQEIAAELNETLPDQPDALALSKFLEKRRIADPERFPDLSLAIVKLLGPGDYVVRIPGQESDGHFGLAVHRYTHSTAPNRRYADLITQRLLKASISKNGQQYTATELEKIATHCNDRESAARKVERKMRKVAAAVFMSKRIGDQFKAIVTGVTPKGTFARILKPPVDGMIVRREHGLKVGQQIQVKLLSTDPEKGFIDFAAL
ncbi:MAG TPA: RNB domain-containing ribonuclease [Pyrinomonadaceae bacterium]|nr:RNB domain-containing ribonuclease [Pyrinomonadaceae bacterium]